MTEAKGAVGNVPAELVNPAGASRVFLVCEHASNTIPPAYGNLGLRPWQLASHIAWDPGALSVARHVSRKLDAPLLAATISRLIYDCNRSPEAPDAIPARSEDQDIPGNRDLDPEARDRRVQEVYWRFEAALAEELRRRGPDAVLVTIHSFTPQWMGVPREVEIGVLHDRDRRLADAVLELAPQYTEHLVRRNEPYGPEDGVTHTLRRHGLQNSLANVMIEIRNDLITDEASQERMGEMLARLIEAALGRLAERQGGLPS